MKKQIPLIQADAKFSSCGRYRYSLSRTWDTPDPDLCVCWVMLNPSTADATQLDPTLRRCRGFTRAWGYGQMTVVNLYALRSTNPKGLWCSDDPVGPENDAAIDTHVRGADLVVVGWGNHGETEREKEVWRIISGAPTAKVVHFGLTRVGKPMHPLYLPADSRTEIYRGPQ